MESKDTRMRVIKRDNSYENISFDKVLNRIHNLCYELNGVSADEIAQKVCARIYDGVKTSELDELAAQLCASFITTHPDYGILASRIIISNHHKNTSPSFSEVITVLKNNVDIHGNPSPLVSDELVAIVNSHKEKLNSIIDYTRDYGFDYFGFKTLERSYLTKVNGKIIERPQHMWLRVALGIHGNDMKEAIETYDYMSKKYFTHATPTLFNAGTKHPQLASCFLIGMHDSINGMYRKCLADCADISKWAGGIGIHIHDIRAKGSYIRSTNGISTGIIPMLRVYNQAALHVNQCFKGDTIVYSNNGPKHMIDINIGDEIITIDGSFKKVLQIARNSVSKDILKIRTAYSMEPVYVTKEHQIYTISGQRKMIRHVEIFNKLKKGTCIPTYKSADELNESDFIGYPIPTKIEDVNQTEDFFRLFGIILGDGHITKKKNCNSSEIGITLSHVKIKTYDFVCNFLNYNNIHYLTSNSSDNSSITIRWSVNKDILNIEYDDIYEMHNNVKYKHIPNNYLHLPINKSLALLKGLFETDGSYDKEIYFYSTSKSLVYSVRYILLRLGILSSGNIKKFTKKSKEPRLMSNGKYIKNILKCYNLRIPKHPILKSIYGNDYVESEHHNYFTYNNILWSRIKNIEEINYEGDVYDFNMEDNHNYLTDMGLVHNSGKRNGSIAVYLEPWHADIENFLELRKNHGNEEERCRDLFTALWIPDIFMKRVQDDGDWCLMCPDECCGLSDSYGDTFDQLYLKYESEGKFRKKVKAQQIWMAAMKSQIETGTPYLLYKDAANQKSNQQNIGTIRSSNLCTEIIEYSSDTEYATCNLGSIALPSFIKKTANGESFFDFDELHKIAGILTRNINKIIDRTYYPVPETELSNKRHRPIGIGIQGLADTYAMMRIAFDSHEAAKLNREIFETIYHGALSASMRISKKRAEMIIEKEAYVKDIANLSIDKLDRIAAINNYLNLTQDEAKLNLIDNYSGQDYRGAYATFIGSPMSEGKFQFDLWNKAPEGEWDWESLRKNIVKWGIRNSLLLAPMPTASTSQILGFNECFEPFTNNIYQRQTLAGEFTLINKYLIKDLLELSLWNVEMKNKILIASGSIQEIAEIPLEIRNLYKTVWEIKQKVLIDQSADRGIYVCQSQSLNLFVEEPELNKLSAMHFYAWKKGLKTGIYYLRTRPKAKVSAFTLDSPPSSSANTANQSVFACTRENKDCLMCSS